MPEDASAALVWAARELAPRISAAADAIERERRLPDWLVDELAAARLFQMLVPACVGGLQTDLATFANVIEILAAADASTAWCIVQTVGRSLVAAHMDRRVAEQIFGNPRTVVARGPGTGTVVATDGGYRLTGEWSFASGCHHATWLEGSGILVNGAGIPCLRSDGTPDGRTLLFPSREAEIEDVWHVSGLRGTGSDTFSVRDLFIPSEHAIDSNPAARELGPLYAFSFNLVFASGFACVALGNARGALKAFAEFAATKTPQNSSVLLRESPAVQSQAAQAEAVLRSARAFLREAIAETWTAACEQTELPLAERAFLRLAATHAIQASARAVDVAYHAAGSSAIFDRLPFERRFRDAHAITQQVQGSPGHFETVGRFLLGLEPSRAFL